MLNLSFAQCTTKASFFCLTIPLLSCGHSTAMAWPQATVCLIVFAVGLAGSK